MPDRTSKKKTQQSQLVTALNTSLMGLAGVIDGAKGRTTKKATEAARTVWQSESQRHESDIEDRLRDVESDEPIARRAPAGLLAKQLGVAESPLVSAVTTPALTAIELPAPHSNNKSPYLRWSLEACARCCDKYGLSYEQRVALAVMMAADLYDYVVNETISEMDKRKVHVDVTQDVRLYSRQVDALIVKRPALHAALSAQVAYAAIPKALAKAWPKPKERNRAEDLLRVICAVSRFHTLGGERIRRQFFHRLVEALSEPGLPRAEERLGHFFLAFDKRFSSGRQQLFPFRAGPGITGRPATVLLWDKARFKRNRFFKMFHTVPLVELGDSGAPSAVIAGQRQVPSKNGPRTIGALRCAVDEDGVAIESPREIRFTADDFLAAMTGRSPSVVALDTTSSTSVADVVAGRRGSHFRNLALDAVNSRRSSISRAKLVVTECSNWQPTEIEPGLGAGGKTPER